MKNKFLLVMGSIFAGLAVALNLVSARSYDAIFIAVIIADLLVLITLYKINLGKRQPILVNLSLGLLVVYTLLDIGLRHVIGTRVFDLLS